LNKLIRSSSCAAKNYSPKWILVSRKPSDVTGNAYIIR